MNYLQCIRLGWYPWPTVIRSRLRDYFALQLAQQQMFHATQFLEGLFDKETINNANSRKRDSRAYLLQREHREYWTEGQHPYITRSDWMSLQGLRAIVDSTTCRCILGPPFVRRAKIVSWHLLRRSAHRNHEALLQVCVCVVCVVCGRGRRTRSVVQISSQSCSRVDKCGW